MSDNKVRDFITAIRNEPVKVFRVYDGSNRVSIQYEAITHALNGDPCMKTEYMYDGTTQRVLKMKESVDTWLSSFDM